MISKHHSVLTASSSEPSGSHSRQLLITAFSVILILALLVGIIGLIHSNQMHQRMRLVTGELNVKVRLITEMHNIARARNQALYTMTTQEDVFQRDAAFLYFNEIGTHFVLARQTLMQMPLTALELQLLDEQAGIAHQAVPIQHQIAELAQADERELALVLLNQQSIPLQNRVLEILRQLQNMQLAAIARTSEQMQAANRRVNSLIIILSLLALAAGGLIARAFIHRIGDVEQQLQTEKELAEITLNSIGDAVITTDTGGHIQFMNPMAEYLTGWELEDAQGHTLGEVLRIYQDNLARPAPDPIGVVLKNAAVMVSTNNIILQSQDQSEFAIEYTAAPIMDQRHRLRGVIVIFRDVTEMRILSHQLSHQASHDALTGLVNRREFENRLEQAIQNARNDNQQHAVCYIDLDQFKIINDAAGHAAGDELLKQLSGRLLPLLRRSDVLARLGGDEFGVLLEGCDKQRAEQIAGMLLDEIRQTRFSWGRNAYEIGASIGLVPIDAMTGGVEEILSAADAACYEAKEKGRNCIHVYHPDDADLSRRRGEMRWVNSLKQAISQDKFVVYCQQMLPLQDYPGYPVMYELLIRLQDDQHKLVPPMAFLPAAERYNMMAQIDRWMLDQAIDALLSDKQARPDSRLVLSVNLSGQSLSDRKFLEHVAQQVTQSGIEAGRLCFEITETTTIASLSTVVAFIKRLKELGCLFALDDFGSGLSSFSYLKNLPVDFLKIDGSFIRDIGKDPMDKAFVESIQRISKLIGVSTIAEYIETAETLDLVREIGIDYAQGYHINKPFPLREIIK